MDEITTLSDVVTLLDAIDSNESDSSSTASFDIEGEPSLDTVSYQSPKVKTSKTKKDRRRKEGPVRYTTSLQRRKKAELKALREEAQQLNAHLELLQLSRLSNIGVVPAITPQVQESNPKVWRSLATIESEGRERAERTNKELKSIMANQIKVYAAIRKILGRSNVLTGMDFVFESDPTSDHPFHRLDFSDAILAELSNSLERLRLETDKVFPTLKENVTITCNSRSKFQESVGKCVVTTSITPMACPMQTAADILWHHITTKTNKDTQKAFRFVRTKNNCLERNCKASLPDGKNLLLNLDGVNIVRKYEEANRIVLVGTTTWFLPTGGLQFEDHHWTTISPSSTDSLRASVVRSCYQLQVKRVDTVSVRPLDFKHVEKVVLNSIGGKLPNVLQLQQNVLLEKIDAVAGDVQVAV